jgi:hypothetical protein
LEAQSAFTFRIIGEAPELLAEVFAGFGDEQNERLRAAAWIAHE